MNQEIRLKVNGWEHELMVPSNRTLLDVLRDDLGLTGTKRGCDSGECGTCTVLLDGTPILSCLTLALEADGREIRTIEGVAKDGELNEIQKAFMNYGAVQCGFCTPGMVLSAAALLEGNPSPTIEEIKKGISGNLCRCTGYNQIVSAIQTCTQSNSAVRADKRVESNE